MNATLKLLLGKLIAYSLYKLFVPTYLFLKQLNIEDANDSFGCGWKHMFAIMKEVLLPESSWQYDITINLCLVVWID